MNPQILPLEPEARPPSSRGGPSITMLDGSTRLRMIDPDDLGKKRVPVKSNRRPAGASFRNEALIVAVLTVVFTAAFWLVISYIRSH